ncbi:MAG TPA: hypothetical protein VK213_05510 [Bacteroidales bacterium]|nr:hypothetical protein [Bacteroidales bacterium]
MALRIMEKVAYRTNYNVKLFFTIMKNPPFIIASLCLYFILQGCSPVKFYSDPGLTRKTGLKYYSVKPYMKVERDQASNKAVKAEIIYLPDVSSPQFLMIKDGPGSRKVDLKLADGTISTLGVATDPQTAETIEALAALVSKSTDAVKDISALEGMPGAGSQVVVELYEILMSPEGTTLRKVEF